MLGKLHPTVKIHEEFVTPADHQEFYQRQLPLHAAITAGDEDAAVQQPVQLQAADASSLQVKASRKAEQVVPLMPHGLLQGSPWQRRSASATEATRRPI